jgi:hypothetical protein
MFSCTVSAVLLFGSICNSNADQLKKSHDQPLAGHAQGTDTDHALAMLSSPVFQRSGALQRELIT